MKVIKMKRTLFILLISALLQIALPLRINPIFFNIESQNLFAAANEQRTGFSELITKRPGIIPTQPQKESWFKEQSAYVKTYRHFSRGYYNLKNSNFSEAAKDFSRIVEIDPENRIAPIQLAFIKTKMGDREEAITVLEKHVTSFPEDGYAFMYLGFLNFDTNRIEMALSAFTKALSTLKDKKEIEIILANIAETHMKAHQYNKALTYLLDFRKKMPADGILNYKIGLCFNALNKKDEALDYYQEALTSQELSINKRELIRLKFANLLNSMGNKTQSIRSLFKIVSNTNKNSETNIAAKEQFMDIYANTGQWKEALKHFNQIPQDKRKPIRLIQAASCEKNLLDFLAAESLLSKAITNGKFDASETNRLKIDLADLMIRNGKLPQAKGVIEEVLASSEGSPTPPLLLKIATLNLKLKRPKKAEIFLRDVISDKKTQDSLRHKALNQLGSLYLKEGKLDSASQTFKKSIAIKTEENKQKIDIYKKMGYIAIKKGENREAQNYLMKALSLSGTKDADIRDQLVTLKIDKGDCLSAIPQLKLLARARVEFKDRLRLARCLEISGNLREAETRYIEALTISFDPPVAIELALLKKKTGHLKDADLILHSLLIRKNLNKDIRFKTLILLSRYYGEIRDREKRIEYARMALEERESDSPEQDVIYALVLTGDTENSFIKQYRKRISMIKDSKARLESILKLAGLFESVGKSEYALTILKTISNDDLTDSVRNKRGKLFYTTGFFKEAATDFLIAYHAYPESILYLAQCLEKLKMSDMAIDYLENALKKNNFPKEETQKQGLLHLSNLYFSKGQFNKSLAKADEALKARPGQETEISLIMAKCMIRLGESAKAMNIARKGLSGAGKTIEKEQFYLIMGEAASKMGDSKISNTYLKLYLTTNKRDDKVYLLIANNYLELNRPAESRFFLKKAISINPENPEYFSAYASASLKLDPNSDAARQILKEYLAYYPYESVGLEKPELENMDSDRYYRAIKNLKKAIDMNQSQLTIPITDEI